MDAAEREKKCAKNKRAEFFHNMCCLKECEIQRYLFFKILSSGLVSIFTNRLLKIAKSASLWVW